jgi:hypothetical protein
MGPIIIFDKSALQALNVDEAVWFDAFFFANVVPIFFVETLADLEKEVARGRTPEEVVGRLAEKTPTSAAPNVHHRYLILAELVGHEVEMTQRPVINAGEVKQTPDGSIGLHVDEFPEQAALLRWMNHDFFDVEQAAAKGWRAELAQHEPERLIGVLKDILPTDAKISDLEDLKGFIDSFCSSSEPETIALALHVLGIPHEYKRFALQRWEEARRPPFDQFAPYTTHVFKVDLLFYLGIHRGFISGERASNKADMAYLYYLPFAVLFVSGDRLHQRTVPLFLHDGQSYLEARELKTALRELDEHYDRLPEEIKALGVMQFASYPPSDVDNAVTNLWDKHMRRDWRAIAKAQEAAVRQPRDERADRETLQELTGQLDEARLVTDNTPSASDDGPDYVVVTREIPRTKGKWRILPKEVEDRHGD